jgi:hypothetical protein
MTDRVVHFEIPFDDGDRARNFYRRAFGWDVNEMPELNYTIANTGPAGEQGPTEPGYINGGMGQRVSEHFSSTVVTIGVDSIDDTLETIEELGGSTLVPKQPVADMGFTAYIKDSEGNVVGLWENAPQA